MSSLTGNVYSHTVIRVPGIVHADVAPFVLLMVDLDNGRRVLGHYTGSEPPAIDTRVAASETDKTPLFSVVQENK